MNKNVIPNLFRNLNNFNDNVNSLSAFVLIIGHDSYYSFGEKGVLEDYRIKK